MKLLRLSLAILVMTIVINGQGDKARSASHNRHHARTKATAKRHAMRSLAADFATAGTNVAFAWGAIPDPAQKVAYSSVAVQATNNPDGSSTITRTVSRTISYQTVVQVVTVTETDYGQNGMAITQNETSY